jgi:hypothetical protein
MRRLSAVDRPPEAVENTAEQVGSYRHSKRVSGRNHLAPRLYSFHIAKRHEQYPVATKPYDLSAYGLFQVSRVDMAQLSDLSCRPG